MYTYGMYVFANFCCENGLNHEYASTPNRGSESVYGRLLRE